MGIRIRIWIPLNPWTWIQRKKSCFYTVKHYKLIFFVWFYLYLNCYIRDALIPTAPGRLLAYDTTPGRGKENIL
jgi:hypothetical protein